MDLGILNETVILIDTDFLNESISYHLNFYKELYPDKNFEKIKLADLLYKFVLNARVEEGNHNIDILFACTLSNSNLKYCTPSDLTFYSTSDGVQMKTDKGTLVIRSFFGDDEEKDESCSEYFLKMLRIVNQSSRVSRIIMIADNPFLNIELEMMRTQNEKSLFIFKEHHSITHINVLDLKHVNIVYPLAYALGLRNSEI